FEAHFPPPRLLPSLEKKAGLPRPRHSASARLRSHYTWRNSWTPCRSSPPCLVPRFVCCSPVLWLWPTASKEIREPASMAQIFHPSTNTIARVSILGVVFIFGGLLWLMAALNRSSYATEE